MTTKPLKCEECGNEEEFEVEEFSCDTDPEGTVTLVEKQKCGKCGALYKATYTLSSWEKWREQP